MRKLAGRRHRLVHSRCRGTRGGEEGCLIYKQARPTAAQRLLEGGGRGGSRQDLKAVDCVLYRVGRWDGSLPCLLSLTVTAEARCAVPQIAQGDHTGGRTQSRQLGRVRVVDGVPRACQSRVAVGEPAGGGIWLLTSNFSPYWVLIYYQVKYQDIHYYAIYVHSALKYGKKQYRFGSRVKYLLAYNLENTKSSFCDTNSTSSSSSKSSSSAGTPHPWQRPSLADATYEVQTYTRYTTAYWLYGTSEEALR